MNLDKLYKMQEKLDKHILEKHNIKMSKEELLDNTILALLVEVGELANTTRCFKHWSTKGMMDKKVILDELADVIHFYLSIGNQMEVKLNEKEELQWCSGFSTSNIIKDIYHDIIMMDSDYDYFESNYSLLGLRLMAFSRGLNFTDEEVEQAYLKKHEENYKRQREGY